MSFHLLTTRALINQMELKHAKLMEDVIDNDQSACLNS